MVCDDVSIVSSFDLILLLERYRQTKFDSRLSSNYIR